MSDRTIARRYAQAFVQLAADEGVVDVLDADLRRALDELRGHDGALFDALCSPVFTREERLGVLDAVLPRLGLHALTGNLLRLLLERGRFSYLPEVARLFEDMVHERAGRVRVKVATAEPLTPQLEAEIRAAFEKVTGKTVLLETSIDHSLIGGMVARVGGKVYDASLRSRLDDIKHRLISASAPAEA